MTDKIDRVNFYKGYLDARTGKYAWRCARYSGVADKLFEMGLSDNDTIVDLGAGATEFDLYMRQERNWRGRYFAVDASFDGVDLDHWQPVAKQSFFVAIELLEHLHNPIRLAILMQQYASKGVAATTPNPATTDVLGMDPTHLCALPVEWFTLLGWQTAVESFYGQPDDSILAWNNNVSS